MTTSIHETAIVSPEAKIGDGNLLMAQAHVAHDCQIGNRTIFANNAQLAGHVSVGDDAVLGGFTVVHQFCRIGAHSITGMGTIVLQDVPPYVKASGNPAQPYGINTEGLRRRGFDASSIAALKRAYRVVYRSGLTMDEVKRTLAGELSAAPAVKPLLDFMDAPGRGIIR